MSRVDRKGWPSLFDRSDASAPSLHGVPNLGQHIRRDLGGTRGQRSRSTLSIPVDVLDEKLHLGHFSYLARDDLIGEVTDSSAERRVGKECGSTGRSRGLPLVYKKQ